MAVERHRSGLLTAGAILTLIAGILGLIEGIRGVVLSAAWPWMGIRWIERGFHISDPTGWMLAGGIVSIILGAIAVVGGLSAFAVRNWGWALAGAICGLLTSFIPGLLGLIFIAASKRDFQ